MNAQTGLPQWQRYVPALDALKPGCGGEEARYRCGIMLMRDNAQRRAQSDPTGMMQTVWLNATEAALAAMSPEQLRDTWGAIGRAYLAARQLMGISEQLAGGDDARG